MNRRLRLLLLCLAALLPAWAQAAPVSEAVLRRHIEVLASDAFEGRKPGTPGGDKAVAYIVDRFRTAGLEPGAKDGGWLQQVALVERKPVSATVSFRAKGTPVAFADTDYVLSGRDAEEMLAGAPLVFAGYGIDIPAAGLRPFAGIDVRGAVVLLLPGAPEGVKDAPSMRERRAALLARGAAAVLLLPRETDPWEGIRAQILAGTTDVPATPVAPISGALAFPAWTRLLGAAGEDAAALTASAARPDFRARRLDATATLRVTSSVRAYSAPDVIGRIPAKGGDGHALFYLAHWDHLGLCRPPGAPDRICNGAVDNASGVAMLIEVARGLAAGRRPKRDIYFVATTAEEMGLLGAKALVADPPAPLDRIVAAINFDTTAITDRGEPVAILGRGMTPLDAPIDATARRLGRKISTSTAANALATRQDGWAFLKAGVPAVMAGGAVADMARLEAFLGGVYHTPADDLAHPVPLGGEAEDADFHIALGRRLADPHRFPAPAGKPAAPSL